MGTKQDVGPSAMGPGVSDCGGKKKAPRCKPQPRRNMKLDLLSEEGTTTLREDSWKKSWADGGEGNKNTGGKTWPGMVATDRTK